MTNVKEFDTGEVRILALILMVGSSSDEAEGARSLQRAASRFLHHEDMPVNRRFPLYAVANALFPAPGSVVTLDVSMPAIPSRSPHHFVPPAPAAPYRSGLSTMPPAPAALYRSGLSTPSHTSVTNLPVPLPPLHSSRHEPGGHQSQQPPRRQLQQLPQPPLPSATRILSSLVAPPAQPLSHIPPRLPTRTPQLPLPGVVAPAPAAYSAAHATPGVHPTGYDAGLAPLPLNFPVGGPISPGGLLSQGRRMRNGRTEAAMYLAARQPYQEPPHRHDLGRMDQTCTHCGAMFWLCERLSNSSQENPIYSRCCSHGDIRIPALKEPPVGIRNLYLSQDRIGTQFRANLWQYNCAFAFTSLGINDKSIYTAGGPPSFRIAGELHHRHDGLLPAPGRPPRYAQLYIISPESASLARAQNNPHLDRNILNTVQAGLLSHHQYVPIYRHAHEVLQGYDPSFDAQVRLRADPRLDKRR
ncbi:hypothetical protein BKA70DRAFT_1447640 [Coprinopsis sp. MPI-PUGE-AT-0042]|nr:hypothetical protein BKA70DRAFT_1447640 [Coprinopsis sp. MPI-PUGE-AT-0042]